MKQSYQTCLASPEAFISISKSRLQKENNNTYYLNSDSEFEIELFNPLQEKICASIIINGKEENYSLVLYPGQRIFLERFMDNNSKFKFSTYDVENSNEVLNAISNNGKIEIKFYKEFKIPKLNYYDSNQWWNQPSKTNFRDYTNNFFYSQNTGTENTSSKLNFTSFSGDINSIKNTSKGIENKLSSIETGIVDKGNISDQRFENSNDSFSTYSFSTINIQLLPISQKSENLNVIYCTNCRTKRKKTTWKFCPNCGENYNS